ncbi:APH(3') family aminoglycoside O-phosphotransferase [Rhizobium sp. P32RR-XVIII]|uniref:APH(3') family aminoglycoside O-phosphotransferase n=1 Tax=Rhizobium sp. P32RR-XVIII TaxID=2726738 RepID=UPI001FEDF3F8|nr:APH(3') family aminoglycoside O-phosphotransferase [Rhizobium sp. P32RR-XVIII]
MNDWLPEREGMPPAIAAHLSGYRPLRDAMGRSAANVFRLEADGRTPLYLKVEKAGPFPELSDEAARLGWLKSMGLACPDVVAQTADGARNWLLMTALPGCDLASNSAFSPLKRVEITAAALVELHRLDVGLCSFDHRLERRIAAAKARMEAGVVDETDFDAVRMGRSAAALFTDLENMRPGSEDLVVTHGDACLPNFIALNGGFSGYIDSSRLGVADRYQDIALACRSIQFNLGAALVRPFLDAYGMADIDPARLDYYQLLDEFF